MNNLQWLLENGGPAIQLRLSALQNSIDKDTENAVSELLEIDNVRTILNYFNAFQTQNRDTKTLEHLIHYYKENCLETFFPQVMDLGFRAGIPAFDEKMPSVAAVFKHVYRIANDQANEPISGGERQACFSFSIMLHRYFFSFSYLFPEVVESLDVRLNKIYNAANEKTFVIHQDESKLPKKPPIWADLHVLKDEMNPWKVTAEKPLPMWFDVWALAYYKDKCTDSETIRKINEIVAYILTSDFQKVSAEGALLYVKEKRIYHANGLGLTLPLYETENHDTTANPYIQGNPLWFVDIMSHFETARVSKWFYDCLNHLEQFKTEKGTYIFPKEYINKKYIDKAFLNKVNISLKGNAREQVKRELVSTMKIMEIYKRIN